MSTRRGQLIHDFIVACVETGNIADEEDAALMSNDSLIDETRRLRAKGGRMNENGTNVRAEAEKALTCLYLQVPESVGDDVKSKVMAALDGEAFREREAICAFLGSPAIFNVSPALIERIRRGEHHPAPFGRTRDGE